MQTLYSAKLGLQAQQQRVNIIAANISNNNTVGYKGQRADFKEALSRELLNPADLQSNANLQEGCGILISGTPRNYRQGEPMRTGNRLDLYLEGQGYFTVSDGQGNPQYTRNGCFAVSNEQDGCYLVTTQGQYVLDIQNNRIRLPENFSELTVNTQGVLSVDGTTIAALNIVDFPNKDGLLSVGAGCYIESETSGAAYTADAEVIQGSLEASNVDLTVELTRLIRAQRAFSLASRAVSAWDQMAADTNNLR